MIPIVELRDVTKKYDGAQTEALGSITLTISAGKITAIMGPSGSGKSTLLNLIAGLDRPTSGSVTVNQQELTRLSESGLARYRRTTVGLVFQFFNLLENVTAIDNVLMPARLAGVSRRPARERAEHLLEQLGLSAHAHVFPARLSGGQRQRVAVARALINRPALLMADEPTGALDSHSGEQVMDLLRDLNRSGQTIVLVTHDERLAERYADSVIRIIDGSIVDQSDRRPALVPGGAR